MDNPSFQAVNDAAASKFVELLASGGAGPSTPDESTTPEAAPASDAAGTTPANDDGATPGTQDVSAAGTPEIADTPTTPEPSVEPDGFDPQKTLSKYATPEERDKALVESQRTILARAEENKKLKAELEALRGGKPTPEAKQEPEPILDEGQEYRAWLQKVHGAKPEELSVEEKQVRDAIAVLDAENKSLAEKKTKVAEFRTKESTLEGSLAKLMLVIESQVEDLKSDPEDFALKVRLEANQKKAEALDREYLRARLETERAERLIDAEEKAFNNRVVAVDDFAKAQLTGKRRAKQETAIQEVETRKLNESWQAASRRLFDEDLKKDNLTEGDKEYVLLKLAQKLNTYVDSVGVPKDFYAWQRGQTDVIEAVRKNRVAIQQSLVAAKANDLPKAPSDNVLDKTKKPGNGKTPSSFDAEMKAASAKFSRALGL